MVSKFPTTINITVKINVVQNAIPSALEGTTFDESVAFFKLMLAAALIFIFSVFAQRPLNVLRVTAYCY